MNEQGQEPQQDKEQEPTPDEAPATQETPDETPVAEAAPPPAAVQPPAQAYAERRLVRRPEGKIIAGVCTGLAAYTGTDPVVWRIAAVVLSLTTGIGLLAYIIAWLVMPMARYGEPLPDEPHHLNTGRWIGIGAIVLGGLIFARQAFGFHTSWFWGILLIGIGLAMWGRDWTKPNRDDATRRSVSSPPPAHAPPATPASAQFSSAAATAPIAREPETGRTVTQPLASPPSPRPLPAAKKRPPSILGRLVVGACALAIGGALLLSNLGVVHTSPQGILALLLGIVGAGLLLGTLWGRARWLIFPGILLALSLTTVSAIPFNTRGGLGPANYTPTSLSTVRHTYEHAAGPLKVDLSRVKFGAHSRTINARLGFGPLLVIVPRNVNVIADGHVQGGPLDLFGHGSAGWDIHDVVESKVRGAQATLRIHARVTFGPLLVDRVGSPGTERFIGRNFHALEVR